MEAGKDEKSTAKNVLPGGVKCINTGTHKADLSLLIVRCDAVSFEPGLWHSAAQGLQHLATAPAKSERTGHLDRHQLALFS